MKEEFRTQGNLKIWQTNDNTRHVWEINPISGKIFAYREEHYEKYRGRFKWVSLQEDTWGDPAFTGYIWGTMTECPPIPPELA